MALFLIGVTQDLLAGAPLGVTPLVLLLARAVVLRHRRYFVNRSFPFVWAGFTLLTGGAMLFLWTLHCLLDRALVDFRGTVFRAVLTISVVPGGELSAGPNPARADGHGLTDAGRPHS